MSNPRLNVYEEVYTSAAELLDRSTANLGIVARTKTFPNQLEPELQSYRGYSMLAELRGEVAERHPPRIILGPCRSQRDYYGVTRVCFAGFDHTGRTTPLAHHLLIEMREIPAGGQNLRAIICVLEGMFYKQWRQPPTWIDPARTIDLSVREKEGLFRAFGLFPSPTAYKSALLSAIDCLVQFPAQRRPLVLCLPKEQAESALSVIIDLMQLLPESVQRQFTAVTHVVDPGDYVRDAWLIVTYHGTPFLERCRDRLDAERPLVLDLESATATLPADVGSVGRIMAKLWTADDPKQVLSGARIWDDVGIPATRVELFAETIELKLNLSRVTDAATLPSLAAQFNRIYGAVLRPGTLVSWFSALVKERLRKLPDRERCRILAAMRIDASWPQPTRGLVWSAILAEHEAVVPCLFERTKPSSAEEESLSADLRDLVVAKPAYPAAAVAKTLADGDEIDRRVVVALLKCGLIPLEVLVQATSDLTGSSKTGYDKLFVVFQQALEKSIVGAQDAEVLCRTIAKRESVNQQFWQQTAFPIVLRQMSVLNLTELEATASRVAELGFRTGTLFTDVQAIIGRFGPRLAPNVVDRWLQYTANTAYDAGLRQILMNSGLLAAPQLMQAIPIAPVAETPRRYFPVRRSGVGPINVLYGLSILVLILGCLQAAVAWAPPGYMRDRLPHWNLDGKAVIRFVVLSTVLVGCWFSEFCLRLWAKNKSSFESIIWLRWVWVVGLCAALTYGAWPSLDRLTKSAKRIPASSADFARPAAEMPRT